MCVSYYSPHHQADVSVFMLNYKNNNTSDVRVCIAFPF